MTQNDYKYAVVDLEATGTGSGAKIIQIGIVLIENGSIIGTVKERTLVCAIVPHILVAIR